MNNKISHTDKTAFPVLIDNIEGNTLSTALKSILKEQSGASKYDEVRIATAFFTSAGFFQVADALISAKSVRLMIGAEFFSQNIFAARSIEETEKQFQTKQLQDSLKLLEKGLWEERNHLPFSFESEKRIRSFVKALKAGNIEIRRYEKDFLHAKTYIFIKKGDVENGGIIVGSSNMTKAGMTTNLELNASRSDKETVVKAKKWFDSLWEEAVPFDLAGLFEELLIIRAPFEIFIRVLWELYGKEIELDSKTGERFLNLTEFQKHGVIRALRIIEECKGVIIADEVGLGKTYIAGEIVKIYNSRRQRALLICPASLRDSTWKRFRHEHKIFIECVSYEELAREQQLNKKDAKRVSEKLQRKIEEYQLVIVDEAHNYRNPDAPKRAGILRYFLAGKKKDVLLLTATPVNNSLWDLYNLIHFFIKQDAFLANKGILSVKEVFRLAQLENPADLSPDKLFPIIDATTVKRTRQFIQKHYKNDIIKAPDGRTMPIIFPTPNTKTVRYSLDKMFPFENIEEALDPESNNKIQFSRYLPDIYLKQTDRESQHRAEGVAGLLRSGLLKRFESSLVAFSNTLGRMIKQHKLFLEAIDKGKIISTRFLQELSADDETALEELLEESSYTKNTSDYNVKDLQQDVKRDLNILVKLKKEADTVTKTKDEKLKKVIKELKEIIKQSNEADNVNEQRNKRKVLIFSFFADTVEWIFQFLKEEINSNPEFIKYKNRIAAIIGSDHRRERFDPGMSRESAINGFAPQSMESHQSDDFDILVTTDVLAEGVNLQQCCHIINYDLPWNPMRLVQRHGRIDRIGSQHKEVFLRTIFPTDKLDALLDLEQRILDKLTLAARSIGVASPIEGETGGRQVFTETREEINQLLKENPSLFERGGTINSAQTGEEYRQTLRKALKENRDKIVNLPWKSGSGMIKGKEQGIFFCTTVGQKRTYLRFVPSNKQWEVSEDKKIIKEIGTCLRLIESDKKTEIALSQKAQKSVYDFWNVAKEDILKSWMHETDPVNLQPKIQKINREAADFIRSFKPSDMTEQEINKALDIVESPWPRRDETLLREQFNNNNDKGKEKAKRLIKWIMDTGLEPAGSPESLPPISEEDIKLICWLAIASE